MKRYKIEFEAYVDIDNYTEEFVEMYVRRNLVYFFRNSVIILDEKSCKTEEVK